MLEKRYQKVFTQSRINECQLLVAKNDSLLISTKIQGFNTLEDFIVKTHPQRYNTYIINEKQIITLPDLRIFDGKSTKMLNYDSRNQNQSAIDIFACGNFEVNEMSKKCNQNYLGTSILNLIDKDSHRCVIMDLRTSLRINSGKNRLYSQDFKTNEDRFDILGILPKRKTNYELLKVQQVPLLDLHQTSFQHLQLEKLSFINEQNVLIHLGLSELIGQKILVLCKYNILNNTLEWKYNSRRFQIFFNRNVHITQNSFLNGLYLIQNHSCILQLFDYRMEGPALTVLTPYLPKTADFNHIERIDDSFKFISLFSQKGGAVNSPFIFDTRFPQHFQMVSFNQFEQKLFFAIKIKYKKPYLFTIQRQYQNYKFKNAKVSKYYFQYPNTL